MAWKYNQHTASNSTTTLHNIFGELINKSSFVALIHSVSQEVTVTCSKVCKTMHIHTIDTQITNFVLQFL